MHVFIKSEKLSIEYLGQVFLAVIQVRKERAPDLHKIILKDITTDLADVLNFISENVCDPIFYLINRFW